MDQTIIYDVILTQEQKIQYHQKLFRLRPGFYILFIILETYDINKLLRDYWTKQSKKWQIIVFFYVFCTKTLKAKMVGSLNDLWFSMKLNFVAEQQPLRGYDFELKWHGE